MLRGCAHFFLLWAQVFAGKGVECVARWGWRFHRGDAESAEGDSDFSEGRGNSRCRVDAVVKNTEVDDYVDFGGMELELVWVIR
jgi:hypothetical protein